MNGSRRTSLTKCLVQTTQLTGDAPREAVLDHIE